MIWNWGFSSSAQRNQTGLGKQQPWQLKTKNKIECTAGRRFDTAVPDDVTTTAGLLAPLPYPTARNAIERSSIHETQVTRGLAAAAAVIGEFRDPGAMQKYCIHIQYIIEHCNKQDVQCFGSRYNCETTKDDNSQTSSSFSEISTRLYEQQMATIQTIPWHRTNNKRETKKNRGEKYPTNWLQPTVIPKRQNSSTISFAQSALMFTIVSKGCLCSSNASNCSAEINTVSMRKEGDSARKTGPSPSLFPKFWKTWYL